MLIVDKIQGADGNGAVVEFGLACLAHLIEAAYYTGGPADVVLTQRLIGVSLDALRAPFLTHNMAAHAIALLALIARHSHLKPSACANFPSGLFAALTKSKHFSIRVLACSILVVASPVPPMEPPPPIPTVTSETLPPSIWEDLEEYGLEDCETLKRVHLERTLLLVVSRYEVNKNLQLFGACMSPIAIWSFLIDPRREQVAAVFKRALEIIPSAIHEMHTVSEPESVLASLADNLELFRLQHLELPEEEAPGGRIPAAVAFAREVIGRSPKNVYAYLVGMMHSVDLGELQGFGVQGYTLACDPAHQVDGYTRRRFRAILVDRFFTAAWNSVLTNAPAHVETSETISNAKFYLQGAILSDSQYHYLDDAPPDAGDLPHIRTLRLWAMISLNGDSFSQDLKELQVRILTDITVSK